MSKIIFKKLSELVYFTNYIIRSIDTNTSISLNESKAPSVLLADLNSKIKDMDILINHITRSKKDINKIPELELVPEIIVKDLYSLIKLMKHDKIIEKAVDIVTFFSKNYYIDDELKKLIKIESSKYNINKLNSIITSNIDECKKSNEYKRIFSNKYDINSMKLVSLKGLNDIFNNTLNLLRESRTSFVQLKNIFANTKLINNGSDIFYGTFLRVLELNYRLRKYFSFKLMIINKFLDDVKDYYKE